MMLWAWFPLRMRVFTIICILFFKGMDTNSDEGFPVKTILFPSEKGSVLEGNNVWPSGTNLFLLEHMHFQKARHHCCLTAPLVFCYVFI